MLRLWSETDMLEYNRSSEQELWPNLFGLLLSEHAIHQFSAKIDMHAHIQYMDADDIQCKSYEQADSDTESIGYYYSYDAAFERESMIHRIFQHWTTWSNNDDTSLVWSSPPPISPYYSQDI